MHKATRDIHRNKIKDRMGGNDTDMPSDAVTRLKKGVLRIENIREIQEENIPAVEKCNKSLDPSRILSLDIELHNTFGSGRI